MNKQLSDYTMQELTNEINRRIALDTKKVYEMRQKMTEHVKNNMRVYKELAVIMGSEDLHDVLCKIDKSEYTCINVNLMIEDGKEFTNKIFNNNNEPIWLKYEQ